MRKITALVLLLHVSLQSDTIFANSSTFKELSRNYAKVSTRNRELQNTTKMPSRVTRHEVEPVRQYGNQSVSTWNVLAVPDSRGLPSTGRHHADDNGLKITKRRDNTKRKKDKKFRRKHKIRKTSSHPRFGPMKSTCPTRSIVVSMRTAEDIYGNIVDVYPVIHIGSLAVDQTFYESFCEVENCSCAGINRRKYKSFCKTTHRYTYAKVVKNGEIGWNYIKVRSGCSCVVQERITSG